MTIVINTSPLEQRDIVPAVERNGDDSSVPFVEDCPDPESPIKSPSLHPFSLHDESIWAVEAAKERGLIDGDDSAVIFHSLNAQTLHLKHLSQAFAHGNALHAISIKTNPHQAVLAKAVALGFGLEAASMEEVHLAKNVGCPPHRIVFDSPIKRRADIEVCHQSFPGMRFNANSLDELSRLPLEPNFLVGLRINPEMQTVSYSVASMYNVSHNESKFGVPISDRKKILDAVKEHPIVQLHVHSGSSMSRMHSAVQAVAKIVELAQEANRMLEATGTDRRITSIDIGGGLQPERLHEGTASNMEEYACELRLACPDLWQFELITEFGQWTTFYTGYAYSDVEYAFQRGSTWVAYVHVGANLFMRDVYVKPRGIDFVPLYEKEKERREIVKTDLAGPLCFAGDYLGKGLDMPQLKEGDGLLMLNIGSNSYGLWSRHCSRTIPKVIAVDYAHRELTIASPRTNPFI